MHHLKACATVIGKHTAVGSTALVQKDIVVLSRSDVLWSTLRKEASAHVQLQTRITAGDGVIEESAKRGD